jgi:two-component system, chemotaxis family, CheB/CheR fusion protein
MLITHAALFIPYELKWRVFRKVPRAGLRERIAFLADGGIAASEEAGCHGDLQRAFDTGPVATVVVDRGGVVTGVNQAAHALFQLGAADVGRPLQDLELSCRPADLRTALERAYASGSSVEVGRVDWTTISGEAKVLCISVSPMRAMGAAIYFEDVTETARLDEEFERSKRQLETAYEELQSTVEELEATNEELQSTNDELEAMNEEQLRRSTEVDRLNLYLEGIRGSIGVGVVVIDPRSAGPGLERERRGPVGGCAPTR